MPEDAQKPAKAGLDRTLMEIAAMPVQKAESVLEAIADREGDERSKAILAQLPPVKIAAILRQHDFSSPSILSWMMTPEMIAAVLKIDPFFWMHVHNRLDSGNFAKIQSEALDLATSLLSNANGREQQSAILELASRDPASLQYLFLPFIGWKIKAESMLEWEDPEIEEGTPDHLYEMIRWAAPSLAQQIIAFCEGVRPPLIFFITDLWSEAFHHLEADRDVAAIENIMFLPVHDRSRR